LHNAFELLAAIHGLPAPRSGSILAPGRSELRIAVEAASHFINVQTDRETLYLDGESRRIEFDWRAGIAEDWELRALGGTTAQAILGGSLRLDPHWLLDMGVGEDLRVDTAPDVTMQIVLRWLP
jgi:hypothetical protein